mmetsp:Transcript_121648/g.190865  ORF Transcript_121648/g.190865 Transcript_121648/m.190865 type:complete len:141 (-) Transcript_121648:66-488(-)
MEAEPTLCEHEKEGTEISAVVEESGHLNQVETDVDRAGCKNGKVVEITDEAPSVVTGSPHCLEEDVGEDEEKRGLGQFFFSVFCALAHINWVFFSKINEVCIWLDTQVERAGNKFESGLDWVVHRTALLWVEMLHHDKVD